MEVTQPGGHVWNKYRKSKVKKYEIISNEILRPERAYLESKYPDFDLSTKRLDVFISILDSKFRQMMTITLPKMIPFITRLRGLCSHTCKKRVMLVIISPPIFWIFRPNFPPIFFCQKSHHRHTTPFFHVCIPHSYWIRYTLKCSYEFRHNLFCKKRYFFLHVFTCLSAKDAGKQQITFSKAESHLSC